MTTRQNKEDWLKTNWFYRLQNMNFQDIAIFECYAEFWEANRKSIVLRNVLDFLWVLNYTCSVRNANQHFWSYYLHCYALKIIIQKHAQTNSLKYKYAYICMCLCMYIYLRYREMHIPMCVDVFVPAAALKITGRILGGKTPTPHHQLRSRKQRNTNTLVCVDHYT